MSTARLAHNVFFKLKDPSDANAEALIAACKDHPFVAFVQP